MVKMHKHCMRIEIFRSSMYYMNNRLRFIIGPAFGSLQYPHAKTNVLKLFIVERVLFDCKALFVKLVNGRFRTRNFLSKLNSTTLSTSKTDPHFWSNNVKK